MLVLCLNANGRKCILEPLPCHRLILPEFATWENITLSAVLELAKEKYRWHWNMWQCWDLNSSLHISDLFRIRGNLMWPFQVGCLMLSIYRWGKEGSEMLSGLPGHGTGWSEQIWYLVLITLFLCQLLKKLSGLIPHSMKSLTLIFSWVVRTCGTSGSSLQPRLLGQKSSFIKWVSHCEDLKISAETHAT